MKSDGCGNHGRTSSLPYDKHTSTRGHNNIHKLGNWSSILEPYSNLFDLVFVKVLECNNIVQAMNILEGLIPSEDALKQVDASHLEKLFVFSLMWSVGALLELEDRKKVLLSDLL